MKANIKYFYRIFLIGFFVRYNMAFFRGFSTVRSLWTNNPRSIVAKSLQPSIAGASYHKAGYQYSSSSSSSSLSSTGKESIGRFYCYFIRSGNVTYNGYTVNLNRRLKQHNGELCGGAKSTRGKGPWEFFVVLTSPTWSKVRAMQVEWLCKYPTRKKPRPRKYSRPAGRLQSFADICERIPSDEVLDIYVKEECMQHLPTGMPSNIRVHIGFKGLNLRHHVEPPVDQVAPAPPSAAAVEKDIDSAATAAAAAATTPTVRRRRSSNKLPASTASDSADTSESTKITTTKRKTSSIRTKASAKDDKAPKGTNTRNKKMSSSEISADYFSSGSTGTRPMVVEVAVSGTPGALLL